jgi:hypothetical protein
MEKVYKIRSVNLQTGTFVVQFDGMQPLSMRIPSDENGYLTGSALDSALERLKQYSQPANINTANGAYIESLVEPTKPTEESVRKQRNILLFRSDWTQIPDNGMTDENRSKWAAYRQQLRDITSASGFPDVQFPKAPV